MDDFPKDRGKIESHADMDEMEFEEFCAADNGPMKASPEFKEGLRKKLLKLMKNLYGLWVLMLGGLTPFN